MKTTTMTLALLFAALISSTDSTPRCSARSGWSGVVPRRPPAPAVITVAVASATSSARTTSDRARRRSVVLVRRSGLRQRTLGDVARAGEACLADGIELEVAIGRIGNDDGPLS